jgi:hypothetical protein
MNDKSHLFEIKPCPDLLSEIKEANESKKLAIFIGAGISRFLDCRSWSTLANNLIKRCEKEELINHFEQEMLSKNSDMKKTITICNQILENDDRFMSEMKKSLNDEMAQKYIDNNFLSNEELENYKNKLKIYRDLFSLNGLFITTNADRHIDQLFEKENIIFKKEDFRKDKIDNNQLYKIHGSIVDKNSLVFTVDQYIDRYYINLYFAEFLEAIFANYTVFFVGYGLNEFELLDYLFKSTHGNNRKHFFLKDYFSHEQRIYQFDQMYFEKIGITLIPYEKDKEGFDQLKEIIDVWVKKMKDETMILQKNFDDIDEALENPNE